MNVAGLTFAEVIAAIAPRPGQVSRLRAAYMAAMRGEPADFGLTADVPPIVRRVEDGDLICPSIRGMGVYLCRGVPMERLFASFLERQGSISEGRWAHWHSPATDLGILPQTGMLGAGLVMAGGVALAQKIKKTGKVVVGMLGDGATNTGYFHEGVNFAAVKQLPHYAQVAIEQFAHPTKRDALRLDWERGFWQALREAAPGSDNQLTFLKCFAGTHGKRIPPSTYTGAGRSGDAMRFMAGLLDGSESLEGLTIDTDLRWILLIALAAGGHADKARIEKELAADNTISGHEKAAAALAVLPDPDTKAESWADGALRDGTPNETQRHIAYVFDTAGQPDVLAPYLDRYLEVAESIWEDKGTQIASTALEYMFPRALTSQETLDRVDHCLATSDANPAAKRYVSEVRADIARALAAQAADA